MRRIDAPPRLCAKISDVLRFCFWAFVRVVMVLMKCDLRRHAICTSVFSFYVGHFYDVVFELLVRRIESPSRICVKMSAVFRFCVSALLLVVMLMTLYFRVSMPFALVFVLFYFDLFIMHDLAFECAKSNRRVGVGGKLHAVFRFLRWPSC